MSDLSKPVSPLSSTVNTDAIASGIASLVWWQFSGTALTPPSVRGLLNAAGMDPDTVPEINPVKALHRAAREFSVTESGRKIVEAVVAEEDDAVVVVNLLQREQQSKRKVAKLPFDTLVWDKPGRQWLSPGTSAHAATFRAKVQHRQDFYDGNAVRDFLVMPALAECKAFTLKRGMYVVPHQTAERMRRVQIALGACETFNMEVGTVQANSGWEKPMADEASASIRDELAELNQQIDGWRSMASRVRSDTVENVISRFTELRQRAELYQEALSVSLDDLRDEVQDMERVAMEVIDGNHEAAAKRDEEKAVARGAKTAAERQREAIANLPDNEIAVLFSAVCEGEQPTERDATIDAIAQAMAS